MVICARARRWSAVLACVATSATVSVVPGPGGVHEVLEGVEMVWEAPTPTTHRRPRGLAVLLHRGGRSALSWSPRGPRCEKCTGMPEEIGLAAAARAAGYATVAVSCHDGAARRWEPEDGGFIIHGLVALASARNWQGLPLIAVGVGCGAGFVL